MCSGLASNDYPSYLHRYESLADTVDMCIPKGTKPIHTILPNKANDATCGEHIIYSDINNLLCSYTEYYEYTVTNIHLVGDQ